MMLKRQKLRENYVGVLEFKKCMVLGCRKTIMVKSVLLFLVSFTLDIFSILSIYDFNFYIDRFFSIFKIIRYNSKEEKKEMLIYNWKYN